MTTGATGARETQSGTLMAIPRAYTSLADMASKSLSSSLRCANELLNAKTASEAADAVQTNMRDQFEAYSESLEEISELAEPKIEDMRATFWD